MRDPSGSRCSPAIVVRSLPRLCAGDSKQSQHRADASNNVEGTPVSDVSTWLTPIIRRSRHLALPLVGTTGIAICIGAFLAPDQFQSEPALSMRTSGAPWPAWLFSAVIALCAGALLMLFALFAPLHRRRRPVDPDAYEELFEPPPVSPAVGALLLLTTVALLVIGVRALWLDDHVSGPFPKSGDAITSERLAPALFAPAGLGAHSQIADVAVASVALLVAAAMFGFVCWLHFGGGTQQRSSPSVDRVPKTLRQAVEENSDTLRFGSDPKAAIIACYACFEQSLAESGLVRAPSETAKEFANKASRIFRLPKDAVHDLMHIFELARFSDQPVREGDCEAAWRALDAVKVALGEGGNHARFD